jgi:diketogulonate reductase-like aldo/keto reductase
MAHAVRQVVLPGGEQVSALGQGTWYMGESATARPAEIRSLTRGIDLGLTLIDTAEMYADGGAEEVVGEAIAGRRGEVFLVSKVLPSNASHRGTIAACERSLRRMRTECIDLYLLHWRGSYDFEETVDAFETLIQAGKVRSWGVSNLDTEDMEELSELPGGSECRVDQVLYNLTRRGVEYDLMPWCRERSVPVMAYSPIEQGRLLRHPALAEIAARHDATPAQIALAWVLRHPDVIAIPKTSNAARVEENARALDIVLTPQDFADLDRAFPPPTRKRHLEML